MTPQDAVSTKPARLQAVPRRDSRMPPDADCILRRAWEQRVAGTPDKEFIRFADGARWCYREADRLATETAGRLYDWGVREGSRVVVWLPNGPELVRLWLAIHKLGAVPFALNPNLRGYMLSHSLALARTEKLVTVSAYLRVLLELPEQDALQVLLADVDQDQCGAIDAGPHRVIGGLSMPVDAIEEWETPDDVPWGTGAILLTSGTTGPSKGVEMSHLQLYRTSVAALSHVTDEDVLLNYGSFCHIAGLISLYISVVRGATVVLAERWQTEEFWPLVHAHQVTTTGLLGSVIPFLLSLPESDADASNSLRKIYLVPLLGDIQKVRRRYQVDVYSVWNMTETSVPLVTADNESRPGICGTLREGMEGRLVDENDCEVPDGQVGELILRSDCPWEISRGYINDPEATAKVWRNGWFHTGDLMKRLPDGNFVFVDRDKDCVRRRAENISCFEVENVILRFPGVVNAAAIGVPSEFLEEELMIVVQSAPGHELDPQSLLEFAARHLPGFMVPRYVRQVDTLPMTPNFKVRKAPLREASITADTWDREAQPG